jgi:shikimate kinase
MRVTLIGFMGAGKSTVARLLGELLGLSVVEVDQLVLARSGKTSIAAIFEEQGEERFREWESEAAAELSRASDLVISVGGGLAARAGNAKHLKANGGVVVYLRTGFDEVCARLKNQSERPNFQDVKQARALYEARAPIYEGCADIVVDTDGLSPEEVARETAARLKAHAERGAHA